MQTVAMSGVFHLIQADVQSAGFANANAVPIQSSVISHVNFLHRKRTKNDSSFSGALLANNCHYLREGFFVF